MHVLNVYRDSKLLHSSVPIQGTLTIGRDRDNDLHVNHADVSRVHATLESRRIGEHQVLILVDKGSTNGTFLNDTRVQEVEVVPGDHIRLGHCRLEILEAGLNESFEGYDDPGETVIFDEDVFNNPTISADRLRALHDLALGLGESELEIPNLLERAAEGIKSCLDFDNLCVLLQRKSRVVPCTYWNRDGPCRLEGLTLNHSLIKSCLQNRRAVIAENQQAPDRLGQLMNSELNTNTSSLCVPLLNYTHAPLGVIYCCTYDPLQSYSREDLQFLMLVASHVAIAMVHRQSIVQLQKSQDELKAAQLQLIQTAKMDSVGRLAAGVAHEVKNPLMTVTTGVDVLLDFLPDLSEDMQKLLQNMRWATDRADSVIRGLLDFSAPKQLEVRLSDLNDIIRQSLLLAQHELTRCHVEVVEELDTNIPQLNLDSNKLQQVFLNLCMNSVHAMPDGGKLVLRTGVRRVTDIEDGKSIVSGQRFEHGEKAVVAELEDSGTGIPEEKLMKVLDPFFTTKPTGKGTGLGLSVVREIIDMHGGSIAIGNRPEGGVRVTLTFKVKEAGLRDGEETNPNSRRRSESNAQFTPVS